MDSIGTIGRLSGHRLEVIGRRFGISDEPPPTLQEAGDELGVSRERVRQITAKIEAHWTEDPPPMATLDEAIDLLGEREPLSATEVGDLLVAAGLAHRVLHPAGVERLASLTGRSVPWSIDEAGSVFSPAVAQEQRTFRTAVEALVRPFGFLSAEVATEHLAEVGIAASSERVFDECLHQGGLVLDQGWFWWPVSQYDHGHYPIITLLQLMLVAAGNPVAVGDLRDGVRRRARFREKTKYRAELVPNRAVLRSFCAARPEFDVDEDDEVVSTTPLSEEELLTGTNRTMVSVLDAAGGVMDRQSFQDACLSAGMNPATFSVYSTYSPVIAHLGTNLWSIRGRRLDPSRVALIREQVASRPREKRTLEYGWTDEGRLRVVTRLFDDPSLIVYLPAPIRPYLMDQRFRALDTRGMVVGEIGTNADGASWGYTPFLSRVGADADDRLIVDFDIAAHTATLRIDESDDAEDGDEHG